jgi:hypothetical protein
MNAARKTIAWICIFSILFVGCYGSALIDPKGEEKERIYSDKIEYVITKDGTKREFVTPPAIMSNALVPKQSVSIPLSDVAQFNAGDGKGKIYMDRIQFIITKDSTKYEFDTPPKVSDDHIVGLALNKSTSIPLSDVSQVCVTKFKAAETVLLSVAVAGLLYLIIAEALLVHDMNEVINQGK